MPTHIVPYIRALITGRKVTATGIAREFHVSHDAVTRMLVSTFPWKQLLFLLVQKLFGVIQGGYLILDDTVLPKPFGKLFAFASYVFCSAEDRVVFGYDIVFLCWSNGVITIPLSWRWYKKGASRVVIAQLLLEEARNKWKIQNSIVLFDSWYAARSVLTLCLKLGYQFVSQFKVNRVFDKKKITVWCKKEHHRVNFIIEGALKVTCFKHEDKYFVTSLTHEEATVVLAHYRCRWKIEEFFKFLKSQLKMAKCQSVRIQSQKVHMAFCVYAYLFIQQYQHTHTDRYATLYQVSEHWALDTRLGRSQISRYVNVLMNLSRKC